MPNVPHVRSVRSVMCLWCPLFYEYILILDSEGGEIDSCTLYETLNDLLEVIR